MSDQRLSWSDANLQDGQLTIPIDPPADEDWQLAFGSALRTMEAETRGQQYEGWDVGRNGLRLTGVEPGSLTPTADFFDAVVVQANHELARHLAERARLEGTRVEKKESVEAQELAALEELRRRT